MTEQQPTQAHDAPQPKRRSLMQAMADRYGIDAKVLEQTLIKSIIGTLDRPPTREEFATFCMVANEYRLNPFLKQIYAFPKKGGGMETIVPVDGWAKLINEHPQFDGMNFEDERDAQGRLTKSWCTMHRKDRSHPIRVGESMLECLRYNKRGEVLETWNTWPERMLRHKSMIQCARYAFGFSGIVDPDEAQRIEAAEQVRDRVLPAGPAVRTLAEATADLAERIAPKEDDMGEEEEPTVANVSSEVESSPTPPTCSVCGGDDHDADAHKGEATPDGGLFFDPDTTEGH